MIDRFIIRFAPVPPTAVTLGGAPCAPQQQTRRAPRDEWKESTTPIPATCARDLYPRPRAVVAAGSHSFEQLRRQMEDFADEKRRFGEASSVGQWRK
jgi:hypothetical protein